MHSENSKLLGLPLLPVPMVVVAYRSGEEIVLIISIILIMKIIVQTTLRAPDRIHARPRGGSSVYAGWSGSLL